MFDIECPYCGAEQEIDHEDGYGYEEGEKHQQECDECEKIFVYTTTVSFDHDAEEAPCLNGGEHRLEKIYGAPAAFFKYKKRCAHCDEEVIIDKEKHKQEMESYFVKLKGGE